MLACGTLRTLRKAAFPHLLIFSKYDRQLNVAFQKCYSRGVAFLEFQPRRGGGGSLFKIASRSRMSPQDHDKLDQLQNEVGSSFLRARNESASSNKNVTVPKRSESWRQQ
ncbi:hypothetical protein Tco_0201303 [Tanacetum coccineum]|uniref:Uncharacterized protein n=1 Tax=Tanacetum coccineum TaxID=301880 RepID=A0ABQ5ARG3_9ASTR